MRPTRHPTTGEIARLWAPMAATWLFMALEGPFLAAIIARTADPKANLAAFGVAYALGLILEAPVIMVLSAATALVDGGHAYRRLRRFTYALNAAVTLALVALVATPAWDVLASALRLPGEVAALARGGLAVLAPWPGAIGYRRFHQGLLIRAERTRPVAYGTVVRLAVMAATAASAFAATRLPGAWIGTAALSAGVAAEAVAARWMARGEVERLRREPDGATAASERLTLSRIVAFYVPLAATSTIGLAVQPVLTFFMGFAHRPLDSFAVLPVVNALTFVFRSAGLSYQEVAIALLGRPSRPTGPVLRFGAALGLAASAALAAVVWTPLADVWFVRLSGLSADLAAFAVVPARILTVLPVLSVLLSVQRAVLVDARRTMPITWATLLELAGVTAALVLTVHTLAWVGAVAAAASVIAGRIVANAWLVPPCAVALREAESPGTRQADGA